MIKYGKMLEEDYLKELHYSQKRIIGAEVELNAVQDNGHAVNWKQVSRLFKDLVKLGWEPMRDSGNGPIVGVKYPDQKHGLNDYILTDTGYCLIELVLSAEYDLHQVNNRFKRLLKLVTTVGKENGINFLGYGIQPITKPSFRLLAPRKRYSFFKKFHEAPEYRAGTTIIASNQSNINMKNPEELIRSLNTLLMLVPIETALFANSPIWAGKIHPEYKAIRPVFWYGAYEPWRVGMPMRPFRDVEDYFRTIWGLGTFLVVRDDKYYDVKGHPPFNFYMQFGGTGIEIGTKNKIKLDPIKDDVIYHNGFVWWDVRIKTPYNSVYVESRPCPTQFPGEQMTVFAFNLGVVENLEGVERAVKGFNWQDFLDARYSAMTKTLKGKIAGQPLYEVAARVLKAAEIGLKKRGLGEEKFLQVLWERIRIKEAPADTLIKIFKKDGMKGLLEKTTLKFEKEI